MAATPEETLADEHRRRTPAAVAAISGGILSLVAAILSIASDSGFPSVHLVRALNERLAVHPSQPGLKAREVLYLDDHALEQVASALVGSLTAAAIAFALAYLYRATHARRPEVGRPTIIVIITGAVLVAVPGLVSAIVLALESHSFADSTRQTAEAARDVLKTPAALTGAFLKELGSLILAMGFVLISLKAMSVGLLTRFMGILGIIVGVVLIIPVGSPLPIVQMFWLISLGMLFLGKATLSQSVPRAWTTGEAQPWPSQQELREARLARNEQRAVARGKTPREKPAPESSSNGKARGSASAPDTPPPEVPAGTPHPSSKKKKRKRR